MENQEKKTLVDYIKKKWDQLKEWLKPDPNDSLILQIIKMIGKAIVVLVLTALSPVILVILLFVFLAAV